MRRKKKEFIKKIPDISIQPLFELFHQIIRGSLKPHLISEDNLTEIQNLLKVRLVIDKEVEIQLNSDYLKLIDPGTSIEICINSKDQEKRNSKHSSF